MEEEITERRVARRPLDASNEDQPQAKRPRQLDSAAASRDPAAAAGPTPKTHKGGSKSTGVAAEARTVRITASSGVIKLRGLSLHRSDGNEMARLLSTLQDAVRQYTPVLGGHRCSVIELSQFRLQFLSCREEVVELFYRGRDGLGFAARGFLPGALRL